MLLAELAEVLTRTSVSKRLALIKQTAQSVLADYAAAVTLAETLSVPQIVPTDPDDDHVLACALPAQADLTVSGDSDLLTLSRYHEIPILLPSHPIASAEELQCP